MVARIDAVIPAVARELGRFQFNAKTMQEHLGQAPLIPRLCAVLLAVLGGGLTLAGIGLYGVMSYAVRRRKREFGIRMAIAAQRGSLLRPVLGRGLPVAGAGIAIGAVRKDSVRPVPG